MYAEQETAKMTIIMQGIEVNVIDSNSGIFVGTTEASGWSSTDKRNHIFHISGHGNIVLQNMNAILDPDLLDTYIS